MMRINRCEKVTRKRKKRDKVHAKSINNYYMKTAIDVKKKCVCAWASFTLYVRYVLLKRQFLAEKNKYVGTNVTIVCPCNAE